MILIITHESDTSTHKVVDWLFSQDKSFKILNRENGFSLNKLILTNKKRELFPSFIISSFWFRQGGFIINTNKVYIPNELISKEILSNQIRQEMESLSHFIQEKIISNCENVIGNPKLSQNINKLEILEIAVKVGLNIPDTIITSSKEELVSFNKKHKKIISKPISEAVILFEGKYNIMTYTSLINDVNNLPEYFFPTLFQQAIDKKHELRVFYIKGLFFSCSIFSQSDRQTKIDFRNYNLKRPNRYVPYQLPKNIEKKITSLMNKLNLNSGSIDILVDKKDRFFFLEVNPVGHFGMISKPCNYNIHKVISEHLY
ncbi:MAG: grasp-with-spasm system ATP-grasp peptide maturase [Dysgonamonadaceae bacterium]